MSDVRWVEEVDEPEVVGWEALSFIRGSIKSLNFGGSETQGQVLGLPFIGL